MLPGAKSSGEPKKKISLHNLKTEKIPKLPKNNFLRSKSREKKSFTASERKVWNNHISKKKFLAQPQGGKKIHASHKASSIFLQEKIKL